MPVRVTSAPSATPESSTTWPRVSVTRSWYGPCAEAAGVDEVVVVEALDRLVRAADHRLDLRDRPAMVADLDRGPVRVRAVLEVVVDRALTLHATSCHMIEHATGRERRDLLERLRAEIEVAVRAAGTLIDDAHRDHAHRAGDLEAGAAPRGVGVVGRVHRGDEQIVRRRVEAAVAGAVGVVVGAVADLVVGERAARAGRRVGAARGAAAAARAARREQHRAAAGTSRPQRVTQPFTAPAVKPPTRYRCRT